jgi:hypothetical protein
VGFLGGAQVGLADDLDERRAAAVQVEIGMLVGVGKAVVQALARVFFQVHAGNADLPRAAGGWNFDAAELGKRFIVLRDLVALGQVGVEIILAREDRALVDAAVQCHGREHGKLHRLSVQNRQSAEQAEADRANIGIGRIAEAV